MATPSWRAGAEQHDIAKFLERVIWRALALVTRARQLFLAIVVLAAGDVSLQAPAGSTKAGAPRSASAARGCVGAWARESGELRGASWR